MPIADQELFGILARLVLSSGAPLRPCAIDESKNEGRLPHFSEQDLEDMLALARAHHVVVRAFDALRHRAAVGKNSPLCAWAAHAIATERCRIENALAFLDAICSALEGEGCDVTVIKSLDHWPDLGSDLDLYSSTPASQIICLMKRRFGATLAPRSWGDRLAGKWNFLVPGMQEAVEVHVGRLGQTGELVEFAHSVARQATRAPRGAYLFRVPRPEDRLIITTLQRMYRHFFLRLCDIVDTAQLLETQGIDYLVLRSCAEAAGIWQGVATFLSIASDYVARYRGSGLNLPRFVRSAACLGCDRIRFRRGFPRVPIIPEAAGLYASQLARFTRNRKVGGTFRLTLLPGLAAAAALAEKITGSDKGIW